MPIYDYRCPECQHVFDALKKVDDRHTATCPECGGTGEHKILKAAALDWKMGVSHDFPTAADKWAKIQRSKNQKGGDWDSNNNRYGGDHER